MLLWIIDPLRPKTWDDLAFRRRKSVETLFQGRSIGWKGNMESKNLCNHMHSRENKKKPEIQNLKGKRFTRKQSHFIRPVFLVEQMSQLRLVRTGVMILLDKRLFSDENMIYLCL